MSVTEHDELDDAVAQNWRTALLLAAQVAEWVARRSEQRTRTDEQAARAETGQAGDRQGGERELARAEVAVADNPAWWDQADPAAVARVYATAQAWEDIDPGFTGAAQRVQTTVRDRYGPAVEAQLADAHRRPRRVDRRAHPRPGPGPSACGRNRAGHRPCRGRTPRHHCHDCGRDRRDHPDRDRPCRGARLGHPTTPRRIRRKNRRIPRRPGRRRPRSTRPIPFSTGEGLHYSKAGRAVGAVIGVSPKAGGRTGALVQHEL